MTATQTTSKSTTSSASTNGTADRKAVTRLRDATETAIDVPVGVVLTVADRVRETVEPLRSRTGVERELARVERRGTSARRKATRRVTQRVERVRTTTEQRVRSARTSAEQQVKRLIP